MSAGGLPPVPRNPRAEPLPPGRSLGLEPRPEPPPPERRCTGDTCGGVVLTPENTFRGLRCKQCRAAYLRQHRNKPDTRRRQRAYQAWYRSTEDGAAKVLESRNRRDEKRRAGGYR